MAASNLNVVVLTGNLTTDPELRHLPSGTAVCKLRLAVNTRRKTSSGEWEDKANYFDVTVWGAQGENAERYLEKGRPVAVQGRLEWREWETAEGARRQAVEIIADQLQFLGSAPANAEVDPEPAVEPQAAPAKAKRSRSRKSAPASGPAAGDDDITF